jgi:putative transposase
LGLTASVLSVGVSDVARKIRIEYPGAIYHVMNRGDRREAIFKDDSDRERFLETLGETCAKTSWRVQAYCLMGNHQFCISPSL